MGRKVTENHTIAEQEKDNVAEELIKQQNATEEFVMGAEPEDTQKQEEEKTADSVSELVSDQLELFEPLEEENKTKGKADPEQEEETFSGTVVLTGAATYFDSGTRYFKNKPVSITDKEAYEHLVKTGLFIRL